MADFLTTALSMVLPELRQRGIPDSAAPGFAAQLAIETGYGTSTNYQSRNNWAGIRGAKVTSSNTRGYITYPDKAAGAAAYFGLLDRRYQPVLTAAVSGDPYKVAYAFGQSPWAATRYRLDADGTNDKDGDAGKILGIPGTEGQALYPAVDKAIAAQGGGGGSWDAPKDVPGGDQSAGLIDKAKDAAGGIISGAAGAAGGALSGATGAALGSLIDWAPARRLVVSGVIVAGAAALIVTGATIAAKQPAREAATAVLPALI